MSILMIGNRASAGKATPLAMQFLVAAAASPLLIAATLIGHGSGIARFALHWPHWSVVARCALVACSATVAHWLIFMGTTKAGAAAIAPMTYVQLVVALVLGWALFGDLPDGLAMLGAAIIIGAGLFLWWSGRVKEPSMTD
jgi:drug/metabolite transporter (DMT)-like permease